MAAPRLCPVTRMQGCGVLLEDLSNVPRDIRADLLPCPEEPLVDHARTRTTSSDVRVVCLEEVEVGDPVLDIRAPAESHHGDVGGRVVPGVPFEFVTILVVDADVREGRTGHGACPGGYQQWRSKKQPHSKRC